MPDYYTSAVVQPEIPEDMITQAEIDFLSVFDFKCSYNSRSKSYFIAAENYSGSGIDDDTDEEYEENDLEKLLQAFIKSSNGKLKWISIEMGFDCSKMLPDGFGGAAWFITENDTDFISTGNWLGQKIGELDNGSTKL